MLKQVFIIFFLSLAGYSQRAHSDQKFSNYLRSTTRLPLARCNFMNGTFSRDRFSRNGEVVINCSSKRELCEIQWPNGRRVSSSDKTDLNGVSLELACVKDSSMYTKLLFFENSRNNSYIQSLHLESVRGLNSPVLVLQDLSSQVSFLYFKIAN